MLSQGKELHPQEKENENGKKNLLKKFIHCVGALIAK
jgi:hypothetical protein